MPEPVDDHSLRTALRRVYQCNLDSHEALSLSSLILDDREAGRQGNLDDDLSTEHVAHFQRSIASDHRCLRDAEIITDKKNVAPF